MTAVVKAAPGPGVELRKIPVPKPRAGEVLVAVKAAGICGSDLHIFRWSPSYWWIAKYVPLVLGHEFCGEIVALGERVSSLSVGQRVLCKHIVPCGKCKDCRDGRPHMCLPCRSKALGLYRDGGFAEFAAVPEENCMPMPDSVSYKIAALTQPMLLAANSADRAGLRIGDVAVIMGPGPIGLTVLVAAQAGGATQCVVVGMSGDESRLDLAKKLGASATFRADVDDVGKTIAGITGGHGADVVFEATGIPETINEGIRMLKRGGKLVSIGIHGKPVSFDLTAFNRADLTLTGMHEGPITWERAFSLVESNAGRLERLITHEFGFADALEAFEVAGSRGGGKVLLVAE
ncbi:MAG: zinc-dependent alcohol dehydrogenase [Bacillota bacterium]